MRKLFFIIFIALIMTSTASARKHQLNYRHHTINEGIPRVIKQGLTKKQAHANIGIIIQSMKTGEILYQQNAYKLFTPASIQKLLTAAAALNYLKPNYIFHTSLLSKGKMVNHKLDGNLFVKFSGDPELTDKDLRHLFHVLHKKGVKEITGHVFIDNSDYGIVPYPPGWIWDDLSYSFAAPLNTIIINRNYFILHIIPAKKKGAQPSLKTDLPDGVVTFTNSLKTADRLSRHCPVAIYSNANNHYKISGCFYREWSQQARKLAIRNIISYTKALIQQDLKSNKIAYKGNIGVKSAGKGSKTLAQHNSPPLFKVIKQMLKESDNLTTNAVFKKLGQTYFHGRGTWKNSLRALKQLLTKPVGIDFSTNLINDGAGLSRYNLLSPSQLSKVLYFAYQNKTIKNAFMNALPIAGKDGTMEYRLRSEGKSGRILAKTGSMTGVTSLAGYVKSKHNGVVSFVIMINGFVKPRLPYIILENQVCKLLVHAKAPKEGRKTHG